MGILLLPTKNKKKVTPNPVVQSLNLVVAPSDSVTETVTSLIDPSGVTIAFQTFENFELQEKNSRVVSIDNS